MNQIKKVFISHELSKAFVDAGLVQIIKPEDQAVIWVAENQGPLLCHWVFHNNYKYIDLYKGLTVSVFVNPDLFYTPAVSYADVMDFLKILQIIGHDPLNSVLAHANLEEMAIIALNNAKQILEYKKIQGQKLDSIKTKVDAVMHELGIYKSANNALIEKLSKIFKEY